MATGELSRADQEALHVACHAAILPRRWSNYGRPVTHEPIEPPTGARLELLRRLGFDRLEHDSHVPFLSHLLGTRRLLVEWGERPALCDAGLFHSAYGTEYFPHTTSAERDEVKGSASLQSLPLHEPQS